MKLIKPTLHIQNVTRIFDESVVVKDVSFSINPGETYVLIGPNGAGKTTLLKMIVGLLKPTSGEIIIDDNDISEEPVEAKKSFGYIPDNPDTYDYLTGREFITFTAAIRGISESQTVSHIKKLHALFPEKSLLDMPMSTYSRGSHQKIAFIAALLGNPKLLIIDEPLVGLDPTSMEIFSEELSRYTQSGGAVLMATHLLSFAKKNGTTVGVLHQGMLIKEQLISPHSNIDSLYQLSTAYESDNHSAV